MKPEPNPETRGAPSSDTDGVMQTLLREREVFLGFLTRRTGDPALAEDILYDAFTRSLDRLDTLRAEESAVAWFYRILRNAVIDHRRRQATAAKALDGLAAELDNAPSEAPEALRAAVCRCVARLADTLKPEYAAALRRVDVEEAGMKAYAAEAGITANNAAVRVFRAREALRARVKECCGRCADAGCADCTCPPPGET